MPGQPLAGLTVVEVGQYIAAPYCAKLFVDLGAEVIKIEPPSGDVARQYGPFPNDEPHPEKSGLFLYLNLNKLGVTLDLACATGQGLLRDLLKQVDIFLTNLPPATLSEWGLDWETVRALNGQLILTHITPYGSTGPKANWQGNALTATASSGFSYSVGRPGETPLAPPADQADYWGAINAAAGTMAAVFQRLRSGRGQLVDVAEADCFATLMNGAAFTRYFHKGEVVNRNGHRIALLYPYTVLPCKDGYLSLITLEEAQWQRFVEAMGNPEWAQQPEYGNLIARGAKADELDKLLEPFLMSHTKAELFQLCREHHVPFAPVQNAADLAISPQLAAREFWVEVEHPVAGRLKYPGRPYHLSSAGPRTPRPAPLLGQHNREVLGGRLGLGPADLAELRRAGVA